MNIPKNRLSEIIQSFEVDKNLPFKPNRNFFNNISIGQRRFHQLIRNEKALQFDEMQRLSDYFSVNILELHESTMKYLHQE